MRAHLPLQVQKFLQATAGLLPSRLSRPLRAAQAELCRSLHLAFRLASTHQRTVVLEPLRKPAKGGISVTLPAGVCWGRPSAVPLPPILADSGWRSWRPRPITVMPQRRASANVWFVHHGQEALCLCLHLTGSVELLRYRPLFGAWVPCQGLD